MSGNTGIRKRFKVRWLSERDAGTRHAFRRGTGGTIQDRSMCGLMRVSLGPLTESEKPKCEVCDRSMKKGLRA